MAVPRVRAGMFLRHLSEYGLKCSASAFYSQRGILKSHFQCTPCLLKQVEVNFISTSSALLKDKSRNKEKSKAKSK